MARIKQLRKLTAKGNEPPEMAIFGAGIEISNIRGIVSMYFSSVYGNAILKFRIGVNAFAAPAIKSNENR